jgi:hypothetical protein
MGHNKLQLSRHATMKSFFIYFYMGPELIGGRLREMGNTGHMCFLGIIHFFGLPFAFHAKKDYSQSKKEMLVLVAGSKGTAYGVR